MWRLGRQQLQGNFKCTLGGPPSESGDSDGDSDGDDFGITFVRGNATCDDGVELAGQGEPIVAGKLKLP